MRIRLYLLSVLVLGVSACHTGKQDGNVAETGGIYATIEDSPQEIEVSKDQFESGGMEIGEVEKVIFNQLVHASAYVVPASGSVSVVSSALAGKVSKVNVALGDNVSVGQVLFSIKGKELIEIQQAYAEAYLKMDLLRENYARQKKLEEQNIGATKDFLAAENAFKLAKVQVESLKAQLSLFHIDPKKVEEGKISHELQLVSVIDGIVSSIDVRQGSIVEANVELMRVVDPTGLMLELHIFEKDLDLLEAGQLVQVEAKGNYIQEKEAILSKIGIEIEPETRSLTCIAELDPKDSKAFVVNQFVDVNVVICEREVSAISEHALIVEDGRYYVLVWEKEEDANVVFRKKQVEIGVIQNEMAEIFGGEDLGDVLVEGGYMMPGAN